MTYAILLKTRIGRDRVYLDSRLLGSFARFSDSSYDFNCRAEEWITREGPCVQLFADRDINKEEELCFFYMYDEDSANESQDMDEDMDLDIDG